jgi:hypothetical protein
MEWVLIIVCLLGLGAAAGSFFTVICLISWLLNEVFKK